MKATALALAVLFATAVVGDAGYDEALSLYRAGETAAAVVKLRQRIAGGEGSAAEQSLLGWCLLRLGRTDEAGGAFEAALAADPAAPDPRTGLGFVALRRADPAAAERRFRQALERDGEAGDAWKGLGLALEARGDGKGARDALRRAVRLSPADDEARELLERNLRTLVEERRPRPAADPAVPLRVVSRARARRLEVRTGDGFEPLFVKGINLGTALPGRFPAEFPDDPSLYRGWLAAIAELGANAVRLYTLHPPSLYRALAEHNREHPRARLRLIQGVWAELPPAHDYDDPDFDAAFRAEIRRVIDAVHGNLELPARPGHAHGVYDADLSDDLLALVLGREWEPFSVQAYDAASSRREFAGRYVRTSRGLPIEAWLASVVETAVAHDSEYYRTQHAVSWVSWPTLDPLLHPTEATVEEELRLRRRHARAPGEEIKEYDNDLVQLDSTRVEPTAAFPAGLFATYHAYPYYPEFMILDPGYARVRDGEGISRYLGYLQDLARHHGEQPVLIGEFGVPTSRGIAHLHPEGQHHGGHTPAEQDRIDARLLRDIHRAQLAGGLLFSWMDEWFKRNWLVMSFESPPERNPLWLNALDAEQNFGLLAARPGAGGPRIVLDGEVDDWEGEAVLYDGGRTVGAGPLVRLRAAADAAYLYLLLEADPAAAPDETWIGIDTYDAERGEHRLPAPGGRVAPGLEFLIRLAGPADGRILVARPYDLFAQRNRRPYASVRGDTADFIEIRVFTNRERYGRDGTLYEARGYSRSPLRHGSTDPGSPAYDALADRFVSAERGRTELRIPWGLLNVADPSSHRVIHERTRTEGVVETAVTGGFRFHVLALERDERGRRVVGELPAAGTPVAGYPRYRWEGWEQPDYRLEPKHAYPALREALRSLR